MRNWLGIHPDILKLGLVSFFTDVSSEAIFSVFAVFFTTVAGGSAAFLGIVEGLADFSASSLDYVSGWLADRSGERKRFALAGYGFSTLAKISLLVGTSASALALFRVVERLGKSFRGPPRDAWLAAVADPSVRGYSFGVHKALDKSGAVLGPFLAYAALRWFGQGLSGYRILFAAAVLFALAAVFILAFMRERPGELQGRENIFTAWGTLSQPFKIFLFPAGIFALAYFSFGFLLLRASAAGFSVPHIVLLYALFNVAFVLAAPLFGTVGDRFGRKPVIFLGYALYFLMCLGFLAATVKWEIVALFLLFGIFYSIDEAQSKAFIADLEPSRRATAIGFYNFLTGILYLPASVIAGALWAVAPGAAFLFGAGVSFVAMASFAVVYSSL